MVVLRSAQRFIYDATQHSDLVFRLGTGLYSSMRTAPIVSKRLLPLLVLAILPALLWPTVPSTTASSAAQSVPPSGDYQRAVLVSWDGVRRDVLLELLEVADSTAPCWKNGDVYPVATGRLDAQGQPQFTCLPTLAGARPWDAPVGSPAYAPFQILASHTTNDGNTMTKPQHASMLTGLNAETHTLVGNRTKGQLAPGTTIYEMMMDLYDPVGETGRRDGTIFRTHMSSDRKYVGRAIYKWAKKSRALQKATGHGNGKGMLPGPLRHAEKSFKRWKKDEVELELAETDFFMFLHYKTPDWSAHRNGADSKAYRRVITETDRKLYNLLEMLRSYGWDDAAIVITTDHGFHKVHHTRDAGRNVFNTWLGAYNVNLSVGDIPSRTAADYCESFSDPTDCLADGPEEPMPAEDVVPNVFVTSVTPTLLDMFGIEWRSTTGIEGVSLYTP
jgi:hypothetical protein